MSTEPIDFTAEDVAELRWLQPVSDDDPCGENLEYDLGFLELTVAAEGTPEKQFGDKVIPGEPPDWGEVNRLAEELLARSHDLRILMLWVRAELHRRQYAALGGSLCLLSRLIERQWDGLHPRLDPDDGNDPIVRLNALGSLSHTDGLLRDVLDAVVASTQLGKITVRDVAIGLERLPAPEGGGYSRGQLSAALADAVAADPSVATDAMRAAFWLPELRRQLMERVGADRVPDFDALAELVDGIVSLLPVADASSADAAEGAESGTHGAAAAVGGDGGVATRASVGMGLGVVQSRGDAIRAIDMVCDFLERTEPTNPAQLLLRRARNLINKNFLELVHELAPGSLEDVAKLMGVSAESIRGDADGT